MSTITQNDEHKKSTHLGQGPELYKVTKKASELVKKAIQQTTALIAKKASIIPVIVLLCFLFIFILICSIGYSMPHSTSSLFSASYEVRYEDSSINHKHFKTPKWLQSITDFFNGISLSFIDASDTEESQTDLTYNRKNEYDNVFLDHKKILRKSFRKAYKEAKKEAEKYCKEHDYNITTSMQTLVDNNCDTWESVYSRVNYGDAISIINMGYTNSSFGTDLSDYDAKALKNYLKDKSKLKYLYQIIYTENTQSIEGIPDDKINLSPADQQNYDTALAEYNAALNSYNTAWSNYNTALAEYNAALANGMTDPPQNVPDQPAISLPVLPKKADYYTATDSYYHFVSIKIYPFSISSLYQMIGLNPNSKAEREMGYEDWRSEQKLAYEYFTQNISAEMGYQYETPFTYNNTYSQSIGYTMGTYNVIPTGEAVTTCWQSLRANGYSRATTAGIMGNIAAEGGFNPSAISSDGNSSIGICQWTASRKDALLQLENPYTIETQVSFLMYEIPGRMGAHLSDLINVNDNLTGAEKACDWFAYIFESPCNYDSYESYLASSKGSKYSWDRYVPQSVHTGRYLLDGQKRRQFTAMYFNDLSFE